MEMADMDKATKIADLTADSKLVYNGGNLATLAKKYGVTTRRYQWWKESDRFQPAFASKSDVKEMQGKLYSTIKTQLRELGA